MERHLNLLSRTFFQWGAATALVLLSGCGGGGGGKNDGSAANTAARAQGAYEGTLGGSIFPNFQLLLLEDGAYYVLAGTGSGSAFVAEGLLEGSGTETSATVFTSTNARDFGSQPPDSYNLSLNYVAQTSVAGSVTTSGGAAVATFNGTAVSGALYDYNAAAQLSNVVGSWDVSVNGVEDSTLTVNSNGTYSGTDGDGCSYSGTITPRSSGKNVFNVTYLSGPAPCSPAGTSAAGVAIVTTPSPGARQLLVVGTTPARTDAFLVTGVPTPP